MKIPHFEPFGKLGDKIKSCASVISSVGNLELSVGKLELLAHNAADKNCKYNGRNCEFHCDILFHSKIIASYT